MILEGAIEIVRGVREMNQRVTNRKEAAIHAFVVRGRGSQGRWGIIGGEHVIIIDVVSKTDKLIRKGS